ncbi:hypothetical protein NHP190003_16210 (plasmid) [Helicobacter sp. NHP19-003]|uniref:Uncharacterized protein n=1 Tax=Helicobacter gastrocanis TaxID=2849641 RepID=A0ABN6I432_9HELI|nr:hypothetical protein [Helicobacter sp. NHP19-003]BCZ18339.1 hypothetical protein NHP190003_16210 [Helicobacter sp. NHP19-003]
MAFKPFSIPKTLNTDARRLAYLNVVLEEGNAAELKDTLKILAESKGITLPEFKGGVIEFLSAMKNLGFELRQRAVQTHKIKRKVYKRH